MKREKFKDVEIEGRKSINGSYERRNFLFFENEEIEKIIDLYNLRGE